MNDILEKPRLRKQDIEFIVERIEAYDDHIDIRLRSNIDALLHVSGSDAIEQAACETVEPVRKVRNQRKDEREIHTVSNGDPAADSVGKGKRYADAAGAAGRRD